MTNYFSQIDQIKAAQSLDELRAIANAFSAQAQGDGGILYSGKFGEIRAEDIAKELARKTGLPIINDTPRAQFFSYEPVEAAFHDSAQRILETQGLDAKHVEKAGEYFLYGNSKALPESPLSVKNSLWGQASGEFTASIHGPVTIVASAADAERVLAQVEMPAALQSTRITSFAGHPLSHVQEIHAQGGVNASLPKVQAQFIDASTKGIFVLPDNFGLPPSQVAISRELATTLQLDGSKFVSAQSLSDSGFVRASVSTAVPTATLAPVAEVIPRTGFSPTAASGLRVVAAAAVVYEVTTTASRVSDLRQQGNATGASSEIAHFAGRNLGGLGLGAAGAALGSPGGPLGMLAGGTIGGVVGAFGGEKLVDAYDRHRIYNQNDAQGMSWNYDPSRPQQGWTRDLPALPETPRGQHFTAEPALAERLTFQANNTAVELALAHPSAPRDPYAQPAGPHDTQSQIAAPWVRDPQTDQWSRHVTDRVLEHGLASTHDEAAMPPRAAQLDEAAQQTITDNLTGSRRGIAAHYQTMYEQRGWAQHGAMPGAVIDALNTPSHTLQASDGHTYNRGADGQWNTPGKIWGTNAAEGNVRNELDATRRAEQATEPALAAVHVAPAFAAPAAARNHDSFATNERAVPSHAQVLRPFSDAAHPQHALYNKLQEVFPPGTSEARLHQATAACLTAHIRQPEQLAGIVGNDTAIYFRSNVLGNPIGQMDMTKSAPTVQQSMQHVQAYDQQQTQMMSEIRAQNALINQQGQHGPAMGGR